MTRERRTTIRLGGGHGTATVVACLASDTGSAVTNPLVHIVGGGIDSPRLGRARA